jgi:UDP-glucose 4-epimerase
VIESARLVTGKDIQVVEDPRRVGDPAVLVSSSAKAQSVLGWQPKNTSLSQILGCISLLR